MIVTLELKPEVEASLVAQARAKGVSLDRYLQVLVEQLAGSAAAQTMTAEQREKAFEEWADGIDIPSGVNEAAFHRENWYR